MGKKITRLKAESHGKLEILFLNDLSVAMTPLCHDRFGQFSGVAAVAETG